MKIIQLLAVVSAITLVSCSFCGKDETYAFHRPIEIYFENENSESLIGPSGNFEIFSSALYNEDGILTDTAFARLTINDWRETWNEENVKYSRNYDLSLVNNFSGKDLSFRLGINYWLEINNCDSYEVNRIQLLVNDSLQIDNDFFDTFHVLSLPE